VLQPRIPTTTTKSRSRGKENVNSFAIQCVNFCFRIRILLWRTKKWRSFILQFDTATVTSITLDTMLQYPLKYEGFWMGEHSKEPGHQVGTATGYGLEGRRAGVRVQVRTWFFSSSRRPDRFWGPSSLLPNGYRGLFPQGKSGRDVKLITHLQLVPRSRTHGSIYSLPQTSSWRSAY
jgi:hypothetical protein